MRPQLEGRLPPRASLTGVWEPGGRRSHMHRLLPRRTQGDGGEAPKPQQDERLPQGAEPGADSRRVVRGAGLWPVCGGDGEGLGRGCRRYYRCGMKPRAARQSLITVQGRRRLPTGWAGQRQGASRSPPGGPRKMFMRLRRNTRRQWKLKGAPPGRPKDFQSLSSNPHSWMPGTKCTSRISP